MKTSSRPSSFWLSTGSLVSIPPSDVQPDQLDPPADGCDWCHRPLPVPRTNTSSRPSALRATATWLVSFPPSELQDSMWWLKECHMGLRPTNRDKIGSGPNCIMNPAWNGEGRRRSG